MASRHRIDGDTAGARSFAQLPAWLHAALLTALLLASWSLVYGAGGTRTAFPHLFYLPIVLAALPFGVRGGLVVAAAAMVLCGPAMPLDVATDESQEALNWLVRGGFFVTVGGLAGISTASVRRSFQDGLAQQLQMELDRAVPSKGEAPEAGWELRVRQMIDRKNFQPVFQPIYALGDGRLMAVEALTRFATTPQATPDVWFNHAADFGMGIELELLAIEAALEASVDLPSDVALTFNASPSLLVDQRLLRLLDSHRDRTLIAEVTEHVIVDDYRQLVAALGVLRARGLRLAVDDAGAGFASLRHIVRLEPEFIKLDSSLTQNLRSDPVRRPLADCLIEFANRTGSSIIAEGIETAADLVTWQEMGAGAAQGLFLGDPGPLPAAAFTHRLPHAQDGISKDERPAAAQDGLGRR